MQETMNAVRPGFNGPSRGQPGATRHTRRWLPVGGALLLVALIAAGLWPRPTPVETAPVAVGRLRAAVSEEGKTRIRERFLVTAPVSGQLRRIHFKAGDEVESNRTVLAVIDPVTPMLLDARTRTLAEARRDTAAANVEKARAAREFAASELRRFQQLRTAGSVSAQEFESIQLRDSTAGRDLAAAESALRQAEAELAEFGVSPGPADPNSTAPIEVRAPANGRVLRVFEESARVVTAGTPLVEVGDPANLEVVVEVLSRDGAAIPSGAAVELEQWGGGKTLEGQVRRVEPAAFTKISALGVEEQRVNVIVDLRTPSDERQNLGDNFRVEAHIIVWENEQTLKVPAGALFRQGPDWAAFVIAEGRARIRTVEVGRSSGTETQVLKGLREGDTVILYPGDRVRNGDRVQPIRI